MTTPARETRLKAVSEGAEQFVNQFYVSLNGSTQPLRNFYASSNAKYAAAAATDPSVSVDITVNGQVLNGGPDEYEQLIKTQRQTPSGVDAKIRYEVEGWDVHILNPMFQTACPEYLQHKPGLGAANLKTELEAISARVRASLILQVTGHISYGVAGGAAGTGMGDDKDPLLPKQMFTDVFVLVPNWDAHVKNPPRNVKRWLVQSQNFRAL